MKRLTSAMVAIISFALISSCTNHKIDYINLSGVSSITKCCVTVKNVYKGRNLQLTEQETLLQTGMIETEVPPSYYWDTKRLLW